MILVTGATGFLGSYVVDKLLQANIDQIRCFVRETSKIDNLTKFNVELTYGSFEDYDSIVRALTGVQTIINVASLGFGHASNIIKACEESGVERGIFFSTTAIFTKLNAKSKKVRLEAEKIIKASSIKYTILRPTMIYGSSKDRNMCKLIQYLKRFTFIPIFGTGEYLQQPVYVDDLAEATLKVLQSDVTINKEYNLAGANPLTYNQVIDIIAEALKRKIYKLYLPVGLSIKLLDIYSKISKKPKLTSEQVLRLNENKNFDIKEAIEDFGYNPIDFLNGIKKEIELIYGK